MVRALALILPLCLDTFAVAAALGVTRMTGAQRVRLGLLFAAFEGGMPVIGLLLGVGLGRVIGGLADYLAIAALAALGVYVLVSRDDDDVQRVRRLANTRGLAVVGLGLGVSLDELAIGFSLGLLNVPLAPAVALVAGQAFIVSQIGFAVGAKVSEAAREGAEKLAGAVLIAIAVVLLLSKL